MRSCFLVLALASILMIPPALAQRGGTLDLTREQQVAVWERDLIGIPVYGDETGRIGTVDDLVVDENNRVRAVVVGITGVAGARLAHVPVPWAWVEPQIGLPTIVLPWSRGDLAWLRQEGDAGETPGAGLGGYRTSWLDGTEAEIAAGGTFGTVEGFIFAPNGQVERIVVRRADGGPFYEIPREHIRVQGEPPRVVIELTRPEVLALERTTRDPDPAPFAPPAEETPRRETIAENRVYRDQMLSELQLWDNRIDRIADELGQNSTHVQGLRRWHWVAEQAWERLAQTSGPNFENQRLRLESAMDSMREQWSQAAQALE